MGLLNYAGEKEVFSKLQELATASTKVVEELNTLVTEFHAGKFENMTQLSKKVKDAESMADKVKGEMRKILTESSFLPQFRQDMFELIQRVENIADSAEAAANFFYITQSLLKKNYKKMPKQVKDAMLQLGKIGHELSHDVESITGLIGSDLDSVKSLIQEVGKKEDDADEIELSALKKIVDSNLDPFLSIELITIVRMLANIIDRCNASTHVLTYMLFTSHS